MRYTNVENDKNPRKCPNAQINAPSYQEKTKRKGHVKIMICPMSNRLNAMQSDFHQKNKKIRDSR